MNNRDFQSLVSAICRENAMHGRTLKELPADSMPKSSIADPPIRAWRSNAFFVQLFRCEHCMGRLTVNRTSIQRDGRWQDGITWDELQSIKSEIGFGRFWAVEVYPSDSEVVDVAAMRHLWLLAGAPSFAWQSAPCAKRDSAL